MRLRSIYLALFLAGGVVIAILIAARPSRPAPRPAPTVNASPAPAPVVATPDEALAATADLFFSGLRALLASPEARPHEATLTFRDDAAYGRFLARASAQGLSVIAQLDALHTVRISYERIAAIQNDILRHTADYTDAAANNYLRIPDKLTTADRAALDLIPLRNTTLAAIGATADRTTWGRGVTIAILDSGVNALDPTFNGRVRTLDVGAGQLPDGTNASGHGTAVAALAAGLSPDAPGVAPAATILSIRVTNADGLSDIFTVAQGILAAVDAGAKIINISLGGYATSNVLLAAIDYADTHGALIVAAAGNDQATRLTWPAADARVISVGAVDAVGQQVTFSNSGPQLQISAPGYGVQTAWINQQRVYVDGTSAAAPLVAGALATVLSANPTLTATQAWEILAATTNDAGAPGPDADYGRGTLNLGWALGRNDPTRVDAALSSHFYDSNRAQMEIIIQNRGGQALSGLTLDVDTAGLTTNYRVPALAAGANAVIAVPVDKTTLATRGALTYKTTLSAPIGINDQDPTNNIKTSRLTAPKP